MGENTKEIIGRRLEELIHERLKITQREFARTVGIEEHYLSNMVAGRKTLNTSNVIKICQTYNVDANWLLGLENNSCISIKQSL